MERHSDPILGRASVRPQAVSRLLFNGSGSKLRYVLIAWPIATVPTLLLMPFFYTAKVMLDIEVPRINLTYGFAVAALIAAPLIETGLMLFVYYLLGLVIWRSRVLRALVLATLAALAHVSSFGGWLHVIGVAWLFVVLSVALAAWVEHRARDAFFVVTGIHLLHNIVVLAIAAFLAAQYAA